MKNVNQLVLNVQAEGTESYSMVELFNILSRNVIEPKAESFRKQLKGDVDEAISEGYKIMMELVQSWDGTGSFYTFFSTAFTNRLKNLVKFVGRNKRKHNTSYSVSLSESVETDGDASPILEVATDSHLQTMIDFDTHLSEPTQLEKVFKWFAEAHPEQAGIINIMIGFNDDTKQSEKTNAYCEYLGVQSYTSAIQKKVSRSREAFKKFLIQNDYQLNF